MSSGYSVCTRTPGGRSSTDCHGESPRDREHHPDRPRRRLRVVQLGEGHDLDARLLDPVAAGDTDVEQPVGDVARDLLRAQDRDVDDARIVDRRLVVDVGGTHDARGRRLRRVGGSPVRASPSAARGAARPVRIAAGRADQQPVAEVDLGSVAQVAVALVPRARLARSRAQPLGARARALRDRAARTTRCRPARRDRGTPRAGSSSTPRSRRRSRPAPAPARRRRTSSTSRDRARGRAPRARCRASRISGKYSSTSQKPTRRRAGRRRGSPGGARRARISRSPRSRSSPVVHGEDRERGVERAVARTAAPRRARSTAGAAPGGALAQHRRATARPRRRSDRSGS